MGRLWTSLADFFIRQALFEKARDVYEEGLTTVSSSCLSCSPFLQVELPQALCNVTGHITLLTCIVTALSPLHSCGRDHMEYWVFVHVCKYADQCMCHVTAP